MFGNTQSASASILTGIGIVISLWETSCNVTSCGVKFITLQKVPLDRYSKSCVRIMPLLHWTLFWSTVLFCSQHKLVEVLISQRIKYPIFILKKFSNWAYLEPYGGTAAIHKDITNRLKSRNHRLDLFYYILPGDNWFLYNKVLIYTQVYRYKHISYIHKCLNILTFLKL